MIVTGPLRKSLLISLAGHITVFSIMGFSFGLKMPAPDFRGIHFWGGILGAPDFINTPSVKGPQIKTLLEKETNYISDNTSKEYSLPQGIHLKPQAGLSPNEDKLIFKAAPPEELKSLKAKEPAIMFYPRLPYDFILYFKDRQVVHIELAFNVVSNAKYNSILIKRRISSGNLEADLLSMRYISRYLFIQQMGFSPDNWNTVKIDLSAK